MILQPGIHDGIAEADYHADPAPEPSASASILKLLHARSPAHAWTAHPRLNPNQEHREPSSAMRFGSAAHALLLGSAKVFSIDADSWRSKDAKAERDAHEKMGNYALLKEDHDRAVAMVAMLRQGLSGHEIGDFPTDGGAGERTMIWQEDGIYCRGRLDWYSQKANRIIDYKTTGGSADPGQFARNLFDMGYDFQALLYPMGVQAITGDLPSFYFVVQETDPPFAFTVVTLDDIAREHSMNKLSTAFGRWRECLASGKWPGYGRHVFRASPPVYELKREEEKALASSAIVDFAG